MKQMDYSYICIKCRRCCIGEGVVFISAEEVRNICKFLGIQKEKFVKKYCSFYKGRLILKSKPNKECIFLKEEGCQIYPVRPSQCRDFPFKWRYEGAENECLLLRLGLVK